MQKWTCDLCGRKVFGDFAEKLPHRWTTMKVATVDGGIEEMHVCGDCRYTAEAMANIANRGDLAYIKVEPCLW